MMSLISNYKIYGFLMALLFGIFLTSFVIIKMNIDIQNQNKDRYQMDAEDWFSLHPWQGFLATVVAGLFIIVGLISTLINNATLYDNHINEGNLYEQMFAEYNTLCEALHCADEEVIKSELYLAVNDYNIRTQSYKEYYNNPSYKYNFTGKYNWNEVPLISIIEITGVEA